MSLQAKTSGSLQLPAGCSRSTKLRSVSRNQLDRTDKIKAVLKCVPSDLTSQRFRLKLYRFLTKNVPLINACVWTWVRLAASAGTYKLLPAGSSSANDEGERRLERLKTSVYTNLFGNRVGLASLLPELFLGLFRDGIWGGFLTIRRDGSGVDAFHPIDPINIERQDPDNPDKLVLALENTQIDLNRPDFYCIPLQGGCAGPFGGSILQAVPFVSYIEQQMVDDMRRASHNSGFHRLHIKIIPPERMGGESDEAYSDRVNGYFDDTVSMIRSCEVDDNPVTWDNVSIEYVGPSSSRDVSHSWFMNHRAMVEEICAGTNLASYLLGYSYGATTTWSAFKFDIVMRQVRSVQAEVARFLEWIGDIDLALAGIDARCRFEFDNSFAYQAMDQTAIRTSRVDNILKLLNAGLVDQETARIKARELI